MMEDNRRLSSYGVVDGSTVGLSLRLLGDIGTFGSHEGSPGLRFLDAPAVHSPADEDEIRRVCSVLAAAGRDQGHDPSSGFARAFPDLRLLSEADIGRLRRELDDRGAAAHLLGGDLKVELTRAEMASRLGDDTAAELCRFFSREFEGAVADT